MDKRENEKTIKTQSNNKKICCVNDMPGVGKIALSAMIPFLSVNGIEVASLPTALVSNTYPPISTTHSKNNPFSFSSLKISNLLNKGLTS